jgi:hypothetical protein
VKPPHSGHAILIIIAAGCRIEEDGPLLYSFAYSTSLSPHDLVSLGDFRPTASLTAKLPAGKRELGFTASLFVTVQNTFGATTLSDAANATVRWSDAVTASPAAGNAVVASAAAAARDAVNSGFPDAALGIAAGVTDLLNVQPPIGTADARAEQRISQLDLVSEVVMILKPTTQLLNMIASTVTQVVSVPDELTPNALVRSGTAWGVRWCAREEKVAPRDSARCAGPLFHFWPQDSAVGLLGTVAQAGALLTDRAATAVGSGLCYAATAVLDQSTASVRVALHLAR